MAKDRMRYRFVLLLTPSIAGLQVVLAAQGYPGSYKKGTLIRNLDAVATAKACPHLCLQSAPQSSKALHVCTSS